MRHYGKSRQDNGVVDKTKCASCPYHSEDCDVVFQRAGHLLRNETLSAGAVLRYILDEIGLETALQSKDGTLQEEN